MKVLKISKIYISIYRQDELYFAVAVRDKKIIKTCLPKSTEDEVLNEITKDFDNYILSDAYISFARSISELYFGKPVIFKKDALNLDYNGFQKKVLLEVMKIPYGEVKTYKKISEAINSKAYRAIGTAIGKNPLPLIIPCHRVIKTDFKIGGFYGGTHMKKKILKNEGIKIKRDKILK